MAAVTAAAVAKFLGRGDDTSLVALAGEHLPIITAWVNSYTRGVGFEYGVPDDPAIEAVIIAATARLAQNPAGEVTVSIDDYNVRKTVFDGFTMLERLVLDGFRRKAA